MTALKPIQIADYFISSHPDDIQLTPMKIIKLVYIAHGWHLGLTGKPLIDEKPQAWKFGPVIPSLYRRFKHFKASKVLRDDNIPPSPPLDENIQAFLDKIWEVYGDNDGVALSSKTHKAGTPWSKTWAKVMEDPFKNNLEIPDDLIEAHYKSLKLNN